jgi:hypothetical protein
VVLVQRRGPIAGREMSPNDHQLCRLAQRFRGDCGERSIHGVERSTILEVTLREGLESVEPALPMALAWDDEPLLIHPGKQVSAKELEAGPNSVVDASMVEQVARQACDFHQIDVDLRPELDDASVPLDDVATYRRKPPYRGPHVREGSPLGLIRPKRAGELGAVGRPAHHTEQCENPLPCIWYVDAHPVVDQREAAEEPELCALHTGAFRPEPLDHNGRD